MVILLALLTALHVTDYDADLRRLERDVAAAGSAAERAVHSFRRASLTGDFTHFHEADAAIDEALREKPSSALFLLRARFRFEVHRLPAAKDDLGRADDTAAARMLAAQIALQEGDYSAAWNGFHSIVAQSRTWAGIACLAHYHASTGDPARADELYREAQADLTAKEMRSFAWIELQRGLLDFEHGRDEEALAHYRRAERAYGGYWLIEEHVAEVLDRLGRTEEAVAAYRDVVGRTRKPEYLSALAEIVRRDDPRAAAPLYAEADRLYAEQLRLYPEAAGGHLVRDLLGREDATASRLVRLAEANVRARPNAEAKLLLAKAYRKVRRDADARRVLDEILQTPWRTAELSEFTREISWPKLGVR
jgi:tetratricopeptide (TPR) repeat protein